MEYAIQRVFFKRSAKAGLVAGVDFLKRMRIVWESDPDATDWINNKLRIFRKLKGQKG